MTTSEANKRGVSPDVLADLEQVCHQAATGGVRDPELIRRVTARSAQARQEILDKFGVQDIGVQIIREMRDRAARWRGRLRPS